MLAIKIILKLKLYGLLTHISAHISLRGKISRDYLQEMEEIIMKRLRRVSKTQIQTISV